MSKKKGASRSAMTLKDFHGGSIPSDLPLPSAPGMTVDRSVYERQGSGTWMSPTLGRGFANDRSGYHRQGSASGVRTFEDKASYFPNPANIGRNYDEDERKPVESRPRSSHSADRFDDHGYEERRGGYTTDRYGLEDQGSFSSGPSFSEQRSSSFSDRFPPSQVTGTGFESDVYVHDEFGLIPVGPPPRVPQEPQLPQHQREVVDTRAEQSTYGQFQQQMPNVAPYTPQQQIVATSPPRSWRTPSHQLQSSATAPPQVPAESATNVWTARRDGDFNRVPTSEPPPSSTLGSSPWRAQSTQAKALETRAVDKVSSARWQSDLTRANERRQQFVSPVSEQAREHQKPSFGAVYPPADGVARSLPYASDVSQSRYSAEPSRALSKSDSGRGLQLAADMSQGAGDQGVRTSLSDSKWPIHSQGGKGVGSSGALRGEYVDRAGQAGERSAGFGVDAGRQKYDEEDPRGRFSETDRFNITTDSGRTGHSDTARGGVGDFGRTYGESLRVPYVDARLGPAVDDVRQEVVDQNRAGYRDASKVGNLSNSGRLSHYDSARSIYPDRTRQAEGGESSVMVDGGQLMLPEIGKTSGTETGRESPSVEQAEIQERPKLKLLPRSKPLEKVDSSNLEDNATAGNEESRNNAQSQSDNSRLAEVLSVDSNAVVLKRPAVKDLVSSTDENDEDASRKVERPKLNLKPRSQPAETEAESEEGSQKVRQLVFGGARPREMVLKERGVDDVLNGALDQVQTPGSSSLPSAASPAVKWEQGDGRVERPDGRAEDKQENRRFERQDRSFERQGSNRVDRLENSRGGRGADNKWDLDKDNQWDQERVDGRRRRDPERQDGRRDTDNRRDIDKQESWRRPTELPNTNVGLRNPSSTMSSLLDPSPRASGRYAYSPTASAVEIAQAFSRSFSMGSTMTSAARGNNSLRSPLSPLPKSSVQGFTPAYGNGIAGNHANTDAPFSRLAEASMPPFVGSSTETQGSGFGLESQNNFYGSGKLGGYGSGDLKRGSSAMRADLATGRDLLAESDDFPGKRGLPLRQNEGYYD